MVFLNWKVNKPKKRVALKMIKVFKKVSYEHVSRENN